MLRSWDNLIWYYALHTMPGNFKSSIIYNEDEGRGPKPKRNYHKFWQSPHWGEGLDSGSLTWQANASHSPASGHVSQATAATRLGSILCVRLITSSKTDRACTERWRWILLYLEVIGYGIGTVTNSDQWCLLTEWIIWALQLQCSIQATQLLYKT